MTGALNPTMPRVHPLDLNIRAAIEPTTKSLFEPTKRNDTDPLVIVEFRDGWAVIHEPSFRTLLAGRTKDDALQAVEVLMTSNLTFDFDERDTRENNQKRIRLFTQVRNLSGTFKKLGIAVKQTTCGFN